MRKMYLLMSLIHFFGLKVTITLNDKEKRGYLDPPKNQFNHFCLYDDKNDGKMVMIGDVNEIKRVSLFKSKIKASL